MSAFQKELRAVLNRYCKENGSDTPDFILAEYLEECLSAYDKAVQSREDWYGRSPGFSGPASSPAPIPETDAALRERLSDGGGPARRLQRRILTRPVFAPCDHKNGMPDCPVCDPSVRARFVRVPDAPPERFERTPEGRINNCSLVHGYPEEDCQICEGKCPDAAWFR